MIDLVTELDKEVEGHIRSSAWSGNRASALGWAFECPRYLELARIDHRQLPPIDLGLQRIFDEGNKQERLIKQDLLALGYQIVEPDKDQKWDHLQITGRCDGRVKKRFGAELDPKPLIEYKSTSPNNFLGAAKCRTQEELKASRNWWFRNTYGQMQGYHLIYEEELGIILFKNKSSGQYYQIDTEIDWEYLDALVKLLGPINENVAKKKPRPAERCEACKRCGFARTVCFVGEDFGPGFAFLSDADLEAKLQRHESLAAAAKEWRELDEQLKDTFRGKPSVVGDFRIDSREITSTKYPVPKDVKDQYREEYTYWRTDIERL